MQPSVAATEPIQVQMPAPPAPSQRSKRSCSVKTLGIMQIILTGLSVGFAVASACTRSDFGIIASGAWGSLFFFLPAGILGILSVAVRVSARRCLAIACMVMSIFASIMAATNIALYGTSIATTGWYYNEYGYYERYSWYKVPMSFDIVLVIISLTEFIVSIVAAAYCCCVMREYRTTNRTIQYVSTQGFAPGMMVYNQPAVPNTPIAPGTFVVGQPTNQPPAYMTLYTTAQPQAEGTFQNVK